MELRSTIDQGKLQKFLGMNCRKFPFIVKNLFSAEMRIPQGTESGSLKPETVNHQEEANSEDFVMGSDAAKFVDKVKDQVRNRQKRMSNVAKSSEEHSKIWGMFNVNMATFMGKNFATVQSSVKNYDV